MAMQAAAGPVTIAFALNLRHCTARLDDLCEGQWS
jgi:hypothetical protein